MLLLWGTMLLLSGYVFAEGYGFFSPLENEPDSTSFLFMNKKISHRIGVEVRPGYVIPTHSFLEGDNYKMKRIRNSLSAHLKYFFQFLPGTYTDRIYGGVYQGIGIGYHTFGNRMELGDPITFYLFQGASLAKFTPRLSFNYEWNFGVSTGWKPYNADYNQYNHILGSKVNAYLNVNFYLRWMLSRQFDLTAGVDAAHFSNGNTKFPNAGLNMAGLKLGIVYKFNRPEYSSSKSLYRYPIPDFPRHISYDLVLFGSWRRKGVPFGGEEVASPDAYPVFGFNFAPMYNFGYKFRAGVSIDGVYDGSANVYTEDYIVGTAQQFYKPSLDKQLALGLSARGEYVMPYFTVGVGLGANVLHGGGDLKAFYQILALKTEITRNTFLHIGYSLQNFHTPNFLMLGIGFRFHNKYPTFHR